MKIIFIACLLTLSFVANAQVNFPVDSVTNKISFTKVMQLDSTSKKEIYNRAKDYIIYAYRSANDVIQLDNFEDGKIIAKGYSEFLGGWVFGNAMDGKVWFTLIIQMKDNKYRYEITNIVHEGYPGRGSFGPLENLDMRSRPFAWTKKVMEKFRQRIYTDILLVVTTLEKQMQNPTSTGVKDF